MQVEGFFLSVVSEAWKSDKQKSREGIQNICLLIEMRKEIPIIWIFDALLAEDLNMWIGLEDFFG